MDIDAMEAGPEMDALVAEMVMGWKQHPFMADCWNGGSENTYVQKHYFRPSTDIAAAMLMEEAICKLAIYNGKVVQHITKSGNSTTFSGLPLKERYILNLIKIAAGVSNYEKTCMGDDNWISHRFRSHQLYDIAHASPLHRCRAALKAVSC